MPDPQNKAVTTVVDKDTYTLDSYSAMPDGSELKNMELTARRKG